MEKEQLVPITQITGYASIIVSDESFFSPEGGVRYFTKEYVQAIEQVRNWAAERAKPTGMDKLYFSYAHYANQRQVGEEKLEAFFAQQGYHIIARNNSPLRNN